MSTFNKNLAACSQFTKMLFGKIQYLNSNLELNILPAEEKKNHLINVKFQEQKPALCLGELLQS